MTYSTPPWPVPRVASLVAATAAALACSRQQPATLASICVGGTAAARVLATIDSTRPPAGAELTAAKGQRFELRFAFTAVDPRGSGSSCQGSTGTATFTASFPERIRTATSPSGRATWRVDGNTMLLDLNPGTRDNNVFVSLPLNGGRGHWGLSTFAGEVAAGETAFVR